VISKPTLAGVIVGASVVLLAALPPLAISFLVSPEDIESGRVRLTPPCPYRAAEGAPCIACGLSRAFSALSRGRLEDARRLNPTSPFVYGGVWLAAGVAGVALVGAVRRYPRAGRG
jgi:hypothetical protein